MRATRVAVLLITLTGFLALSGCGGGGGGGGGNRNPVADAGSAQTVDPLELVTLDGSNSTDPDGNINGYNWSQTSGPDIALSGTTTATPSFTAPSVIGGTVLVFRLTVTDNASQTDIANVSITVRGPPVFTLRGIISAPSVVAVDSDTNDILAPYVPNDTPNQAQTIANPITLGGYVNVALTGEDGRSFQDGDRDDYFRVDLLAGQTITMLVSDFQTGDADLFLYDNTGQLVVEASANVGKVESVMVPVDGIYFINAHAFSGASNYVLAIGNIGVSSAGSGLSTSADFVSGQAIVRYKTGIAESQGLSIESMASERGFSIRAGAPDRQMLLKLDSPVSSVTKSDRAGEFSRTKQISFRSAAVRAKWETLMAIKALQKDPAVVYAEPNYIRQATATTPNDEAYSAQWHYPLINLPAAWDLTTGSPGVIVAVIDTGVLLNHPDMQGQLVAGYDFIRQLSIAGDGDGIDPNPNDPGDGEPGHPSSFHGTHVSGTVAAASNNSIGGAGVAWNARIMPLRVLGIGGGTAYDIAQAVRYAARLPNDSGTLPPQRADIINLSLGGGGFSQTSQDAYTAARNAGVIIVAAAGNESSSQLSYPASYSGVISVSAVDAERKLAPYSNFGTAIDAAAPGGNMGVDLNADGFPDGVLSAAGDDSSGSVSFNYEFNQGTSMASPHVAGVLALMKSVNSNLTPAIIDQELSFGRLTDDLGIAGRDDSFGHGLINAHKAVARALTLVGTPPPDAPVLGVTPASLNFSAAITTIEITVQNIGTGTLQVLSTTPSDPWITVSPTANVDGNGLGTYAVSVDRNSLADGIYSGQVEVISDASPNPVTVSAIMSVGAAGIGGDVGFIYLLLIDTATGDVIDQATPSASNGVYAYNFFDVPAGSYRLLAGTDADNDFLICDAGEACGTYLTLDQPIILDVNSDQLSVDFPIGYVVALPATLSTDDKTTRAPFARSRKTTQSSQAVAR